ncbi:unnamed protein product [Fraxinus pennsylvanica]|uniref:Uncharacterized protein n=1 Tax=Fraxinus pennsylvanica TaxID=56036 RepID=A0AAD2DXP5_9LAMI|nr:unnamed protein product [Fraxinus pennsylvanica]
MSLLFRHLPSSVLLLTAEESYRSTGRLRGIVVRWWKRRKNEWSSKEKKMVLVAAEGNLVLLVELMADFGSNMVDKSAFVLSSAGGVNGGFTGINAGSQGGSGGGRQDSGTCGNSGGGNSMAEGDCSKKRPMQHTITNYHWRTTEEMVSQESFQR